MKKKEKQGLIILVAVSILIIGIIWFATKKDQNEEQKVEVENEYVQVQEDGSKSNTSNKVKETKSVEGVRIENVRFNEVNGQTMLIADITNTTANKKDRFLADIVLYNKSGQEIGRIPGVIGEMQAGETIEMQAGIVGIEESYVNAYDYKIEKK